MSFLMCPPKYFGVEYVINPWMTDNVHNTNYKLSQQQWQAFYNQLKQYAQVELIDPVPHLPDLVFTANAGLVKGKRCLLTRFHYPERQPEESVFERWFEKNGYKVATIPNDIFFEGAGDGLFQPDIDLLWMGYGFRSDLKARIHLEKNFAMEVIPLRLVSESFYHLDTCFCPLRDGYVMYYPAAFDKASKIAIEKNITQDKQIFINKEDAHNFVCNAVLTNHTIFVNAISTDLKKQLEDLGYEIIVQPVTEFNKAGGANKCLTLKL